MNSVNNNSTMSNFSPRIQNLIENSETLKALPNFPSNPDNFTIDEKRNFIQGFVSYADESLHQIKEVARVLPMAWLKGYSNLLLLGLPGYGKSELAEMFYDYLVITNQIEDTYYFVQSMSAGTSVEQLLGSIKLDKFQKDGSIEYQPERSFMVHKYACLEEIFQASLTSLTSLKDILMSKCLRNGEQQVPLQTRLLVGNSNKLREELVEDADTLAFFDRFRFEVKVGWTSHEENDYMIAAKKALKIDENHKYWHLVKQICWGANVQSKKLIANGEVPISPRNVIKTIDCALCFGGLDCLSFTYDFIPVLGDVINHSSAITSTEKERLQILEKYELIEKMTPLTIVNNYKQIADVMNWLSEETFEDGNTTLVQELSDKAEVVLREKFEVIKGSVTAMGTPALKKLLAERDITNDELDCDDDAPTYVSDLFNHKDFTKVISQLV